MDELRLLNRSWLGRLLLPNFLAVFLVAALGLRAQIPTSYSPSGLVGDGTRVIAADVANDIPEHRQLTANERAVVERMLEAAAEYARLNPKFAPQVQRIREAAAAGLIRRGSHPIASWITLPDFVRVGGGSDRYIEPGGRSPGGGQIMQPNLLIACDGMIDGAAQCDPANNCLSRAIGIWSVIHEGFRAGTSGSITSENVACSVTLNAVATYAADIAMWNDFLANGVPVPGAPNCRFVHDPNNPQTEEEKRAVRGARKAIAEADAERAALCDELRKNNCPIPPECS